MPNRLLLLICFLVTSFAAQGHTGSITGTVKEASTGEPLIGSTVQYSKLGSDHIEGVVVDVFGKFRINQLDIGTYTLVISFIGYDRQSITTRVEPDKNSVINISMVPGLMQLADVTVLASSAENNLSTISDVDIKLRPINNSQDILRLIPGLFIAQHAGGGKAEQIFLRGFDIDHGTDINLTVDGMPVNMVSHAHGQGYSDLHFLIPETVDNVDFNKGPYNIRKGDFTTAGYAGFETKKSLDKNLVKIEGGQFNTIRTLAMIKLLDKRVNDNSNQLYVASEYFLSQGYFELPQNFNRFNVMAKYNMRVADQSAFTATVSTFSSHWNGSGQIPQRAVDSGLITRFGAISEEGGETSRTNLNVEFQQVLANNGITKHQFYTSLYDFRLASNFTFYLEDPVNGDQITQQESRKIYGYTGEYLHDVSLGRLPFLIEAGGGFRYDDINDISLSHTINQRTVLGYNANGNIDQTNLNLFANGTLTFTPKFSMSAGVRIDQFHFVYENLLDTAYSRKSVSKGVVSPKVSFNYMATPNTTFYLKGGYGFHSNDARVVTVQNGYDILPKALGADLGTIWKPDANIILQAAVWVLDLDQEFVYVGDAGIVEPSGETLRTGLDLSARGQLFKRVYADFDFNITKPRAKGEPEDSNYIPLAPTITSIGGITVNSSFGVSGSLRYRYMGDRAANETNTVIAKGYTVMDMVLNYTIANFTVNLSCQNLLDTKWNEAQFDTESRLKDEPVPVSEIHFTPGTPRFIKVGVSLSF